ncbi:hypothetical protein AKJ52_02140 [candidate division MSBL1 archaeon SCGC-AAA382C18]|uniref:Uncharacterized protein n=1 Tax=candidate division MSBL1 archaeon SCGC-AAA382C18 TaxID=1698281 RepID=A0A133VJC6_9EURY|nr:hypothetical protein AKJ52_02140 [candidate division MSBL1 archaeon SCGC-AAA382C18]
MKSERLGKKIAVIAENQDCIPINKIERLLLKTMTSRELVHYLRGYEEMSDQDRIPEDARFIVEQLTEDRLEETREIVEGLMELRLTPKQRENVAKLVRFVLKDITS